MAKPQVVVETIVQEIEENRITIAVTQSTDWVLEHIYRDFGVLLMFSVLALLFGLFFRDLRLVALLSVTSAQTAFLIIYGANLDRKREARKMLRESARAEVRKFRDLLPSGFGFLFYDPPVPQIWGLTLEKKKQA